MENKPGVMIYFDMLPMLERLSDKNAGILFRGILQYGATGEEPELPDKLQLFWPLIQMRLNADDERYRMASNRGKYAAYTRWARKRGVEPLPYLEWACNMDMEAEEY